MTRRDLIHVAQGFLMGGADVIPGVSGGTVALILGIYERLVTAISHFDLKLLNHLRRGELAAAARHVDLVFLVLLGSGIALGIALLAGLMHWLLNHQLQHTFAAFFGMILASTYVVARLIKRGGWDIALGIVAGTLGAYWLVGLPFLRNPPIGPAYVFACGVVSICAMILPGISGAFVLLLLGTYAVITRTLRDFLKGQLTEDSWLLLAFVAGAALGLLGFTKFLRWLLSRFEAPTMAVLCGFMLGSLRKIWPYKTVLNSEATEFETRQFANVLPDFGSVQDWQSLGILLLGGGLVLGLEYVALKHEPPGESDPQAA